MIYTINKTIYNDFDIIEENKLKARSYFIPFDTMENMENSTYLDERYTSSRVQLLNGDWDFKYYEHSDDLPGNFDPSKVKFDHIEVPSTWQRKGYDQIAYINTRYAFKKNPPHIPQNIPVGVYRKSFAVDDESRRIITFLGVANNLSLYINGQYVGYSEGSHNTAEFDISGYIHKGDNELVAVVFKWCNGSYLECQDMFRENGIFRDVYITKYSSNYIYDIGLRPIYVGDGKYDLDIDIDGEFEDKVEIEATIEGEGVSLRETLAPNGKVTISHIEPQEWSAEIPNLYEAVITLKVDGKVVECIRQYVGFKHIDINGEVFKFNDRMIKMKGVNHHDTHPVTGYVMSIEDLIHDIRLMKEYNVNTVRTSHYPPDPIMLTMCDMLGLYVIDEADIETHGFYAVPYTTNQPNKLSNDLAWKDHYLDRVARMHSRDKNHPSITMWSLGNESGGYKCQDACYDYLKAVSKEIPVHYEGVIRSERWAYDVVSHMYANFDLMRGIKENRKGLRDIMGGKAGDKYKGKPFLQCEYAHAMGVGPGGLDDYMQLFYSSDQFMGGCIWEWADHTVYDESFKYKWTYGGDHGEKIHDGNFCVDGLFFPDRRPSTGALNMRAVYRPIRMSYIKGNEFELFNTNAFLDTSYLDITYTVLVDGEEKGNGVVNAEVPAWSKAIVVVDMTQYMACDGDIYVRFEYKEKDSGRLVAMDGDFVKKGKIESRLASLADITKDNGNLVAKFDGGEVVFSKRTGEMLSYNLNGVEYLNTTPDDEFMGFRPKVYRAEIDNDRFTKIFWMINGLCSAKPHCKGVKLMEKNGKKQVIVKYGITTRLLFRLMNAKVVYTIDRDGKIDVTASLSKVNPFVTNIPKFGLSIELNPEIDNVKYYGRGDAESLSDFNAHALMGIYETTVHDMPLDYIKPQDSGNRSDVRWAELTTSNGEGVRISAVGHPINFNVNEYSYETLRKAGHLEDLDARDTTFLYVDGFVRGAGSNSCGPQPEDQHRVKVKYGSPLTYSFTIEPIRK